MLSHEVSIGGIIDELPVEQARHLVCGVLESLQPATPSPSARARGVIDRFEYAVARYPGTFQTPGQILASIRLFDKALMQVGTSLDELGLNETQLMSRIAGDVYERAKRAN